MQHSRPGATTVAAWLLLALVACAGPSGTAPEAGGGEGAAESAPRPLPVWGYEVVRAHPHDPDAFTQGLAYRGGKLYEGTGRRGSSSLREVEIDTGAVLRRADLPLQLFGEGITLAGDRIYQLTWTSRRGFVYDLGSFEQVAEFAQVSEGWGLTSDGEHLIQSDGSARLYFLDPDSFAPVRTLEVTEHGEPIDQINELEWVEGEIWANVWHRDHLLRISPRNGAVLGRIDLSGLLDPRPRDPEAVLNGIAYDPDGGRLWVTGKLWPSLFEIRIRRQ